VDDVTADMRCENSQLAQQNQVQGFLKAVFGENRLRRALPGHPQASEWRYDGGESAEDSDENTEDTFDDARRKSLALRDLPEGSMTLAAASILPGARRISLSRVPSALLISCTWKHMVIAGMMVKHQIYSP